MADGVRLMLDDLARHRSAVRGQRGDERDQVERDARSALLLRPRLLLLSGLTGNVDGGGGGVARHVAEPGMPEQVVPVGMGGEPGDHRNAEPVQVIGELVQLGAIDAGIDQDQPILPAHRRWNWSRPTRSAGPRRRRPPDSARPSPPQSVGYGAETAIRSQIHRFQRPLGAIVGVAELAGIAAGGCRLDDASAAAVRRAALVHGLARVANGRATRPSKLPGWGNTPAGPLPLRASTGSGKSLYRSRRVVRATPARGERAVSPVGRDLLAR